MQLAQIKTVTVFKCDHPNCQNFAQVEVAIFDEDGEDQGREMVCRDHAPSWAK